MPPTVTIVVEGTTDAAIVKRLLRDAGLAVGREYVKHGKDALKRNLSGYNTAARFSCWLVLRDLDHDGECGPELRRQLLPTPSKFMRLHVAVRAVEAWILADAEGFSAYFSVPRSRVPANPEALDDPKSTLVSLARRSRRRFIREALPPAEGTTARIGPGYVAVLTEFVREKWRPEAAERRSDSLASLRKFLDKATKSSS
jgi:hypothetical protein